MTSNVWDEIAYSFLNFNGGTVKVWDWISNVIPHFIMDVIFNAGTTDVCLKNNLPKLARLAVW